MMTDKIKGDSLNPLPHRPVMKCSRNRLQNGWWITLLRGRDNRRRRNNGRRTATAAATAGTQKQKHE